MTTNQPNPTQPSFDWTVDEAATWPPRGRRPPPYGATALEVMRSCALRTRFDASKGYERRMGYAARIGTAYHLALESLITDPPHTTINAEIAEIARARFFVELAKQDAQAASRPRERSLPKDEGRINRALEAIVLESQKLARFTAINVRIHEDLPGAYYEPALPIEGQPLDTPTTTPIAVEVEQAVYSKEGLFQGRIDRVEHLPTGIRIIDTKTAVRDDVPERYERQLQLYAYLWYETHGVWPTEAELLYPFTSSTYRVRVDPDTCQRVVSDYRALVVRVQDEPSAAKLASPGDVCKVCDFRPWCKPFWDWQSGEQQHSVALERSTFGFQGIITSLETPNQHWKLIVTWRGFPVRIVAPIERFPQLHLARVGQRIRCFEMRLTGNRFAPQAQVTEYSEIFLVAPTIEVQ